MLSFDSLEALDFTGRGRLIRLRGIRVFAIGIVDENHSFNVIVAS